MISKINLNNRNAFEIIDVLRDFNGAVYIEKLSEDRRANAKSLLGLLSLGIVDGDEINVIIEDTNDGHERVLVKIKSVLENE